MLYTAFILGIVGSLHCVGMCGPLTLLLPKETRSKTRFLTGRLVYNLGRISTYALLGILIGFVGEQVAIFVSQKWVSIGFGILIVIGLITYWLFNKSLHFVSLNSRLNTWVSTLFGKTGKRPFFISHYTFGLVNGLLPCGMVYAALAGAFMQVQVWQGGVYMLLFGLGTLPLMLLASVGFGFVKNKRFFSLKYIVPASSLAIAMLLIFRGLPGEIPSLYAEKGSDFITQCKQLFSSAK
ncbi:MAG: sulfite exporter TauE/SafE family protein [Spirosomataceae bacterium]